MKKVSSLRRGCTKIKETYTISYFQNRLAENLRDIVIWRVYEPSNRI